jgi:hypothetical protein
MKHIFELARVSIYAWGIDFSLSLILLRFKRTKRKGNYISTIGFVCLFVF